MTEEEVQAPGWDAIDAKLKELYGDTEPLHYGTVLPFMLGGEDPLDGISVYAQTEPVPHWHYVTYGFSELYEKEGDDPDISGYGFELTMRLKREGEEEPPAWPMNMLQNLGRYVFRSGNVFAAGHYLDANGPIALDSDTELRALFFIRDSQLGEMDTPNGSVEFLQVAGITLDELDMMKSWRSSGFLPMMEEVLPLGITDLKRTSVLRNPAIAARAEEGIERDGSGTGSLFIDSLAWQEEKKFLRGAAYTIEVGAKQAPSIANILRGRIPYREPLYLIGSNQHVACLPGDEPHAVVQDDALELHLNEQALEELASRLVPRQGSFTIASLPKVQFHIVKTEIRNPDGEVVETIG
ncbi:suppressor of fused domain protein [Paenibacillus dendritiformis]|uniref:suppressor of fused domain protein n=1 Tax=Paenibacillus dendritiformis TaxID=130049 RepID=UPI00365CA95D